MDVLAFRLLLWCGRTALQTSLGAAEAARLRAEAPGLLPALTAQLPDLGRSGARSLLIATCFLVAFHRSLPGRSAAENTALFGQCHRALLLSVPRPLRRLYRWIFFQPWFYRRLLQSIVGGPPGLGFGGVLVEVEGGFGVDYHACALQTFIQRVQAPELGPHICTLDFVESEVLELGLTRGGTIGQGARGCDFRWRRLPHG